jgi:hypothetical protein
VRGHSRAPINHDDCRFVQHQRLVPFFGASRCLQTGQRARCKEMVGCYPNEDLGRRSSWKSIMLLIKDVIYLPGCAGLYASQRSDATLVNEHNEEHMPKGTHI